MDTADAKGDEAAEFPVPAQAQQSLAPRLRRVGYEFLYQEASQIETMHGSGHLLRRLRDLAQNLRHDPHASDIALVEQVLGDSLQDDPVPRKTREQPLADLIRL
jgi:hypothetical protein